MGILITIYTDHWTLQNFDMQSDLSQCQLKWQEFTLQYDMTIVYILGEDNTVADADSTFPRKSNGLKVTPLGFMKLGINATLEITVNLTKSEHECTRG